MSLDTEVKPESKLENHEFPAYFFTHRHHESRWRRERKYTELRSNNQTMLLCDARTKFHEVDEAEFFRRYWTIRDG